MDAPVLVGDPEGRVVFANAAFKRTFCQGGISPHGESLATLFSGGGREAVLVAVERVCAKGEPQKFRLREDGRGYFAVVSPIEAEESRVGVIILLTDEPIMDARLLSFHREIQEPLEETLTCLDELNEETGGRRNEHFRELIERGSITLGRARKWSEELHSLLCGGSMLGPGEAKLQAGRVLRRVAARLRPEFDRAEVELELLIAPQIADAQGDETMLETVLVRMLRTRLCDAPPGSSISLLVREVGSDTARGILVSVVDPCRDVEGKPSGGLDDREPETRMDREIVEILGGRIIAVVEAPAGRVTSIRLGLG
jgi:hypothetical protein